CDLRSPRLRRGLLLGGLAAWGAFSFLSGWVVGAAGGEEVVLTSQVMARQSVDGAPFGWGDPWPGVAGLFLDGPHDDTTIEVLASGGFAAAVVGLCLHVGQVGRWMLAPLAAVGSMALTVYSLQIVAIWHWDLLGSTTNGPLLAMVLVTLAAATAWRFLLGRGPLERLVGAVSARAAGPPERPERRS
ncbi:MAG TPA: hypothetical protein VN027_15990, partial [Isoptericola sp.]|nr:hypothetical protein [Isoptericola sp.]